MTHQFVLRPPGLQEQTRRHALAVLASLAGLGTLFPLGAALPYLAPAPAVVNTVAPGLPRGSAPTTLTGADTEENDGRAGRAGAVAGVAGRRGTEVVLMPLSPLDLRPPELADAPLGSASAATTTDDADGALPAPANAPEGRSGSMSTASTGPVAGEHARPATPPPTSASPSEVAASLPATTILTEPDEQPRPGLQPRWSASGHPGVERPVAETRALLEPNYVPLMVVRVLSRGAHSPRHTHGRGWTPWAGVGRVGGRQVKQDIRDTVLCILSADRAESSASSSGTDRATSTGPATAAGGGEVRAAEVCVLATLLFHELLAEERCVQNDDHEDVTLPS
jgi:hypothetical protein